MKSSDPQPSTNHLINCPGASCRGALPFCASSYCMLTHWKERHGGEEMPQWLEKEIAISSSERKAVLQWGARSSAMSRKRKAAEDKAVEATLAASAPVLQRRRQRSSRLNLGEGSEGWCGQRQRQRLQTGKRRRGMRCKRSGLDARWACAVTSRSPAVHE